MKADILISATEILKLVLYSKGGERGYIKSVVVGTQMGFVN